MTPRTPSLKGRRRDHFTPGAGMLAVAGLAALAAAGCEGPTTPVYLNEQILRLPKTTAGVSCMRFELNDTGAPGHTSGGSECAPGAQGACLSMGYSSRGNQVVIDIADRNGRPLLQKKYDEAFFRSGRVDEFKLRGENGEEELFRYWGGFDANGQPICAARGE